MSLHIIHSNRVENLLDDLAEQIKMPHSEAGFLDAETILLDNRVLGKWLNLKLAMKNSVAANIRYVQLSEVFWELSRALVSPEIPKQTPLSKEEMTWRLLGVLEDETVLLNAALKPVRNYLAADENSGRFTDLKRYQLAASVADLFDQYLVYRSEWINDFWEGSTPVKLNQDDTPSELWRNAEAWQRVLWHEMVQPLDKTDALHHRAAIQKKLLHKLDNGLKIGKLPFNRLFVFGVTSMSEAQLDLLMLLGKYIRINLYILNPCEHEWFQIRSKKQILKLEQRLQRKDERKTECRQRIYREELEFMEIGNPLLAGQATQVQDFIELIYRKTDQYQLHAEIQDYDYFQDPGDHTLLRSIQKEILELQYCGEVARLDPQLEGESGTRQTMPGHEFSFPGKSFPSIHIHNCHSPQREVEILHDQLLDIFTKNKDIKPRDVVVMMPEVAPYIPFINAIFESTATNHKIPYHISDRTLQEESPILNSFETLLKLPDSRLPLSEVLSLLEIPAIHRRFKLDREGFETLKSWLIDSGARWGLNASHRNEVGLPPYSEFSWDFGMNRLLAGYVMKADASSNDEGDTTCLLEMTSSNEAAQSFNILPLDDVEGGGAEILDSFLSFWDKLKEYRITLKKSRHPLEWKTLLEELLNDFYEPEEEDWRALNELRRGIGNLAHASENKNAWYVGQLPLEVIRAVMQPVLQQPGSTGQPWSEGVKFCSLLPMRGVPFKVVYLLGMNMEDYPRRIVPKSFDLMRNNNKPGDRSARTDDRWLFLEALLSARDAFFISYIGQDMHRNEKREPSVVVSELIDYIRDGYELPDDAGVDDLFNEDRELIGNSFLYTKHQLQPFNRAYFQAHGNDLPTRSFSYNQQAYEVAEGQLTARNSRQPSGDERWKKSPSQEQKVVEVNLDDFVRFFTKPWDWFFKKKEVTLSRYDEEVSDEEMFELQQGLGPWKVLNELLEQVNQPGAPNDCSETRRTGEVRRLVEKQKARGAWPIGSEGETQESKLNGLSLDYLFMLTGKDRTREAIKLEIPVLSETRNGEQGAVLKIVGELDRYGNEFLIQSASNAKKYHLLNFCIRFAIGCCEPSFRENITAGRVVFKNTNKPLAPANFLPRSTNIPLAFSVDQTPGETQRHHQLMKVLASLYMNYRETGLPFHPELSMESLPEDPVERLLLIEKQWYGTGADFESCIKDDIKERSYFGSPQSLLNSARFIGVAETFSLSFKQWLGRGGNNNAG